MQRIYGSSCNHQEPSGQGLSNRQERVKLGSCQDHSQGHIAKSRLLMTLLSQPLTLDSISAPDHKTIITYSLFFPLPLEVCS